MYDDLSKRQVQILDYIKQRVSTFGYPPSVREIGQHIGLSSSSTVHNHLSKLEDKGYIRRDPSKPRAIEVISTNQYKKADEVVNVPVIGRVTAGNPILAFENVEDVLSLSPQLIKGEHVYALKVQGESMIGAGILDNDYVVVNKQDTATNGDIVVALLEDEATVKRFYKENGCIRLQPENMSMEPIISKDVKVLGKVVAVIRKIH